MRKKEEEKMDFKDELFCFCFDTQKMLFVLARLERAERFQVASGLLVEQMALLLLFNNHILNPLI